MEFPTRYVPMGKAEAYTGCERRLIIRMIEDDEVDGFQTPGGHWRLDLESWNDYASRAKSFALAAARRA